MVEHWFRELTQKRIRRGSIHSVPDLIDTIERFIEDHNQHLQFFGWTAPVERILEKVAKSKEALDALH